MEKRIDKINYYLNIAETVAQRSTCLRKKSGAVIVNNDEIVSTGYSGAPRGRENCMDLGFCSKKKFFPNVRHAGYDACRSVHAEMNAIREACKKLGTYDLSEYINLHGISVFPKESNTIFQSLLLRPAQKKYGDFF